MRNLEDLLGSIKTLVSETKGLIQISNGENAAMLRHSLHFLEQALYTIERSLAERRRS